MYSCEFLAGATECGAEAPRALSVRHRLSDAWQSWPVCVRHEGALTVDLEGIGFVVSAPYDVDDGEARRRCEYFADSLDENRVEGITPPV
jgi:hypothetical protein